MTKLPEPLRFSLSGGNSHPAALELLRELLGKSLSVRVSVSGMSMRPTLEDGDTVIVRKAIPSELKQGDLLLYLDSLKQLTLHRLLRSYRNDQGVRWLQTSGDATRGLDMPIQAKNILAVVCQIEKAHGTDSQRIIDLGLTRHRLGNRLRTWHFFLLAAIHYTIRKIQPVFIRA